MRKETFALFAQDRTETAQALRECNARTARYQLTLSDAEIGMLLGAREDALQASGRALLGLDARTLSLSPAEQTRLLHKIRTLPRGALQAALDGAARDVCRALGLPGAEGYVQAALRALVPRLYEAARHGSVRAVFPVAAEEK